MVPNDALERRGFPRPLEELFGPYLLYSSRTLGPTKKMGTQMLLDEFIGKLQLPTGNQIRGRRCEIFLVIQIDNPPHFPPIDDGPMLSNALAVLDDNK